MIVTEGITQCVQLRAMIVTEGITQCVQLRA